MPDLVNMAVETGLRIKYLENTLEEIEQGLRHISACLATQGVDTDFITAVLEDLDNFGFAAYSARVPPSSPQHKEHGRVKFCPTQEKHPWTGNQTRRCSKCNGLGVILVSSEGE